MISLASIDALTPVVISINETPQSTLFEESARFTESKNIDGSNSIIKLVSEGLDNTITIESFDVSSDQVDNIKLMFALNTEVKYLEQSGVFLGFIKSLKLRNSLKLTFKISQRLN